MKDKFWWAERKSPDSNVEKKNIIFHHPAALRNFTDKTQIKCSQTVFRAATLLFSLC
jgi:hypothetical protein